MTDQPLILDTPEGIDAFRMLSIYHRLKLESLGFTFKVSTFAAVRRELGLSSRTPRIQVLHAWEDLMEKKGITPGMKPERG